jgi:protein-L-isoaspartate(D-aspartate) O-methyltransferase
VISEIPQHPFSAQHQRMLDTLVAPPYCINSERVLEAMAHVNRHEFVPKAFVDRAYADSALPLSQGQTISQPFIVARMTELLDLHAHARVLEIGTGSGYQAAVLSEMVDAVYSIEIVPELARSAAERLARLGYQNIHLRQGDGYIGWPEAAPFDAIIVTCAPDAIPQPLQDQLVEAGRMAIPVGGSGRQSLLLLEKHRGELTQSSSMAVRFVPMTGQAEQAE